MIVKGVLVFSQSVLTIWVLPVPVGPMRSVFVLVIRFTRRVFQVSSSTWKPSLDIGRLYAGFAMSVSRRVVPLTFVRTGTGMTPVARAVARPEMLPWDIRTDGSRMSSRVQPDSRDFLKFASVVAS